MEFGRWPRAGGIVRTIAVLSRPGANPCVSISHWREGKPAGVLLIFAAHVAIVRAGVAGARAARPDRIDAGRLNLGAGHEALVFSRAGLLCLGKSAQSGAVKGLLTVLAGEEITTLSRALDELAKRPAT